MFQGFIFLFFVMSNKSKIETMTRKRQKVFIIRSNIPYLPLPSEYKNNRINRFSNTIRKKLSNKEFTEHILSISQSLLPF